MRAIILADGPAKRWSHHTPKHLIQLNGEVLLHRTVRQLRSKGITDIWITSHDPRYDVEGAQRFEPSDNHFQVDQFYACHSLWHPCTNAPVIFLYGDVYFSDAAIDIITSSAPQEYLYFQRTWSSSITGKNWKEGFAMSVMDTASFLFALEHLREGLVSGTIVDEHHQLQGYLEGRGSGPFWGIGPHGIEIDDETDDFDFPGDIQAWLDHTRRWKSEGGSIIEISSSQERRNSTLDFWQDVASKLPSSAIVLDLGAHAMEEAQALLPLLPGRPSWHAFEPHPECCSSLREHVLPLLSANADIFLSELAVSHHSGTAVLYQSKRNDGGNWTASSSTSKPKRALEYYPWLTFDDGVTVSAVALDDYCRARRIESVDLLKMNIQGAEIAAIRGGQQILTRTNYVITAVCEGEEYEGQLGLNDLVAAMPGKWRVVERLLYSALLQNVTRIT
jgi:FkbM family methyltransferase